MRSQKPTRCRVGALRSLMHRPSNYASAPRRLDGCLQGKKVLAANLSAPGTAPQHWASGLAAVATRTLVWTLVLTSVPGNYPQTSRMTEESKGWLQSNFWFFSVKTISKRLSSLSRHPPTPCVIPFWLQFCFHNHTNVTTSCHQRSSLFPDVHILSVEPSAAVSFVQLCISNPSLHCGLWLFETFCSHVSWR